MLYISNNAYISHDHMKKEQDIIELGLAIENERKKRNLTQTELGELSSTSINFISQIEAGKSTAQIGKVIAVLKVLGLQLVIEKGVSGVINNAK